MRDVRCKASVETVRAALVGNYQPEHVFALTQALALYDFYQRCVEECDRQIEQAVGRTEHHAATARSAPPQATSPYQAAQRGALRCSLGSVPIGWN